MVYFFFVRILLIRILFCGFILYFRVGRFLYGRKKKVCGIVGFFIIMKGLYVNKISK